MVSTRKAYADVPLLAIGERVAQGSVVIHHNLLDLGAQGHLLTSSATCEGNTWCFDTKGDALQATLPSTGT